MNVEERFARKVAELEDKLNSLMRTGIGLGHSAFDNGQIQQYTDGVLGGSFGTQFDGSNGALALNGPKPPTPRWTTRYGPAGEGVVGGVRIRWEGYFEGGDLVAATLDHKEIEVHGAPTADLDGVSFETLKTTITSARGGEVLIPLPLNDEGYYFRLTATTNAGRRGDSSTVLGPFYPQKIREEDLGFDVAALGGTKVFYGSVAPTGDKKLGDLWLREILPATTEAAATYETYRWSPVGGQDDWVLLADQGASEALAEAIIAQQAAQTRAKVFTQDAAPTGLASTEKAIWFESDAGNRPWAWQDSAWVDLRLGNGAIQPNSLVARDVVATGTVTAALLEAIMVLANTIVSGDPAGTHTKITPTGVYVYAEDVDDGVPNEVIRMGTSTNDFFGITDGSGLLQLSLDDSGAVNARTANFREDIIVAGRSVFDIAQENRDHSSGYALAGINNVTTEIGLVQVDHWLEPGRLYELGGYVTWLRDSTQGELVLRLRDGGANIPTINSPEAGIWTTSGTDVGKWSSFQPRTLAAVATAGMHRYLLTAARQGPEGSSVSIHGAGAYIPAVSVIDLGPYTKGSVGSVNRGGGGTVVPAAQQYDTGEMAPAGWRTFRGDGSQRTDVNEVVQGWDPSGYNGDGRGYWWWSLPSITGTVDRVDLYLYSSHWYYNSGGTAIINIMPVGTVYPFNKAKADWHVGGFPKPGGKWMTLPSDWFHLFKNVPNGGAGRCDIISLGPSGGTNLAYYGKFPAGAPRLRIWYTQ